MAAVDFKASWAEVVASLESILSTFPKGDAQVRISQGVCHDRGWLLLIRMHQPKVDSRIAWFAPRLKCLPTQVEQLRGRIEQVYTENVDRFMAVIQVLACLFPSP